MATTNISTETFPADREGNAELKGHSNLASPCIAPIAFVANGASGAWVAATGVE